MDMHTNIRHPWHLSASSFTEESERDRKRQHYTLYYDGQINYIREYFKLKGFHVADAALGILLEKKRGNWRKDDYTLDYGHEVDQLLARISAIESGEIGIEKAEKEHGPIESMLISTLVHDLGEDFGMMPRELESMLRKRISNRPNIPPSYVYEGIIKKSGQSMERLTHDRHYTIEAFKERFGENLDIPIPKDSEILSLSDDIKDMLWDQMNVLPDHGREDFQAFIKIHLKTGEPRITVTRYGKKHGWGADWNKYMDVVMRDAYDASAKFVDSANGMTSRLSIKEFTATGYNRYLRKRVQLFDLNDATQRMKKLYPALTKDFDSIGGMMGVAYTYGQIFANHHPELNVEGESGFSAQNLPLDENGVMYINPHDYFGRAPKSYIYTPGLSHPIARFMQQYRDVVEKHKNTKWSEDVQFLYDQTRASLIQNFQGCEINGLKIEELIDNPEAYDPMPQLLERLRREHPGPDQKTDRLPVCDA